MWRALIHQPRVSETRFQPVSMLDRGSNKQQWLQGVARGAQPSQGEPLQNVLAEVSIGRWTYYQYIILPTIVLISLPPTAGAVVAWKTPPIGWGCRSLSFVCYAACQLLVTGTREMIHWFSSKKPVGICRTMAHYFLWFWISSSASSRCSLY